MSNSKPNTTVNILGSDASVGLEDKKILLVAQMISGTATSGVLQTFLNTKTDYNNTFGAKSAIAKAGRAIVDVLSMSRVKPIVHAIGLTDNGSGVAATGGFAISGTATESGVRTFYVDSFKNGSYQVTFAVGATATSIGASLAALITANTNSVVTAINTAGTVALTAINKGTQGNTIGLKVSAPIAGLTITKTAMSGGTTDPSLAALFDPVAAIKYDAIIYPGEWTISNLNDFVASRANVDNKVLDGAGWFCKVDTFSNHVTAVNLLNEKYLRYIASKLESSTPQISGEVFESPLVIAASMAAIHTLRLVPDANLSSVSLNAITIGNPIFAAIPLFNTPIPGLPVIPTGQGWTADESLLLENAGCVTLTNNPANTQVIINSDVTTYKTNAEGFSDLTFKYINYVDTDSVCREYIFNNLKNTYPQSILTEGQLVADTPQVNKDAFIATLVGYYTFLSTNSAYALLVAGLETTIRQSLQNVIYVSLISGTITVPLLNLYITTQLRNLYINLRATFIS